MTNVKLNCKTPNVWEYLFIEGTETVAKATMFYVRVKKVGEVIKLDVDFVIEEEGIVTKDRFRFTATQQELDYYNKDMAIMQWLFFVLQRDLLPSFYNGLVQFGFYPIANVGEITNLFGGGYGRKLKKFINSYPDVDEFFYINSRPSS